MKKNELLAVIAQMQEQLNSLKAMVENLDNNVEEVVVTSNSEELPAPPEVVVLPQEVLEDINDHAADHEDYQNEVARACSILNKLDFTSWSRGRVSHLNIHLKTLQPKNEDQKPYVLWKQGIYEIDVYDIEGKLLGTSPQFKLDRLGVDLAMYLRTKNVGGYEKNTYKAKNCYLMCE